MHYWNCGCVVTSFICFHIWMHWSPHRNAVKEMDLDKTLFTFFTAQLAISILGVFTSLHVCTDANEVAISVGNFNHVVMIGLTVSSTHILAHRYFLKKAKVFDVSAIGYRRGQGKLKLLLNFLTRCFVWERRILLLIGLGIFFHVLGLLSDLYVFRMVSYATGAIGGFLSLIINSAFSIASISAFLLPISVALKAKLAKRTSMKKHRTATHTGSYIGRLRIRSHRLRVEGMEKFLRSIKLITLIGWNICTISTFSLHVNVIYFFFHPEKCATNQWCHPYVTGVRLDSILNVVGFTLACCGAFLVNKPSRHTSFS
jgi:hypothetical protein